MANDSEIVEADQTPIRSLPEFATVHAMSKFRSLVSGIDRLFRRVGRIISAVNPWLALAAVVYAALVVNHASATLEARAATRSACSSFGLARASLSLAGTEAVRVLEGVRSTTDRATQADIQEKDAALHGAYAALFQANAELTLVAGPDLASAANHYNELLQIAITGTLKYYQAIAREGSAEQAGESPRQAWKNADDSNQAVVGACQRQIASGNLAWPQF